MSSSSAEFPSIEGWYREQVRPFLERHKDQLSLGQKVSELDEDLRRAEGLFNALKRRIAACFLGNSGVGKSTLINALVAEHELVVPSGGIGPLTAQALRVSYAESPSFTAEYHPAQQVNKLLFAITRQMEREAVAGSSSEGDELAASLPDEIRREIEGLQDTESEIEGSRPSEMYRKQAQLLVTGRQDGNGCGLETIVEGLRRSMGMTAKPEIVLVEGDADRVARLSKVLGKSASHRLRANGTSNAELEFRDALRDHACGFLSPVIQNLEVQWPSKLLQTGITLVDLPGLGVAGDVYRNVTSEWVTKEARAIVLVVDRSGITEPNAQLLRTSGFLNRLLHSADDPDADPVALMIAIVRLDDIAETRRKEDTLKSKSKELHFVDVCREAEQHVRGQLRETLERVWSHSDQARSSEAKQHVIAQIASKMRVFPLSAIQYGKYLAGDEDDQPFVKSTGVTGVPAMVDGVADFVAAEQSRRTAILQEACDLFLSRVQTTLKVIEEQWHENIRDAAESERLRADLKSFLQPLRERYRVRQGQFQEFIRTTVPARISEVISRTKELSGNEIRSCLRPLRAAHWKTLQAAVSRGGAFDGSKKINLPQDFAMAFEEPIAEQWGACVLKEVRDRTSLFAEDCVALIDEILVWANGQKAHVRTTLIEALREEFRADASRLRSIGRNVVGKIREEVKNDLRRAIEEPIRLRCSTFVGKRLNEGSGVRNRILELFEELADEAVEAAVAPATAILQKCYGVLVREVQEVFDNYQDPLKLAEERIVESHEAGVRRSDARKRKVLLADLKSVADQSPSGLRTDSSAVHGSAT